MEEKTEPLILYELEYSDLMLLSADPDSISSYSLQELERVESISSQVLQALGPSGPGLLSITGVPNTSIFRSKLLPLARKLALLIPDDCKRILKEHGLGSDVPLKNVERSVSSFAMQLKYMHDLGLKFDEGKHGADGNHNMEETSSDSGILGNSLENEFKDLGCMFEKLGICMMELGIRLARVCDRAIGGEELVQSLMESCAAKGRLIHYHSALDNIVLKEAGRRRGSNNGLRNSKSKPQNSSKATRLPERAISSSTCGNEVSENSSNLWQQWHYDYGVFTVLTDPLFIVSRPSQSVNEKEEPPVPCDQECPSPSASGHTCLQIFNPRRSMVQVIKSSPESFIVQVGEAADILTKGRLRGTLHSVCKVEGFGNHSRETFVVFLQPAWSKILSTEDYPTAQLKEEIQFQDTRNLEFQTIVPPLSSRLKDGMTFAEFSRETTKQYYGSSGLQSNRRGCCVIYLECFLPPI